MSKHPSFLKTIFPAAFPGVLIVALSVALTASPTRCEMVAQVMPQWSPYHSVKPPEEIADLAAEARELMAIDPFRVAEVLGKEEPQNPKVAKLLDGLRADAYFFIGGPELHEAKRLYRTMALDGGDPYEVSWLRFMLGTINYGLGLKIEAEQQFRQALQGPDGPLDAPWTPALIFNLSVIEIENRQFEEARARLQDWLERYPGQPGKPLVLYLLGECETALDNVKEASAAFEEALQLNRDAWLPRPEIGYALAKLLRGLKRPDDAIYVLERLVENYPGAHTASQALLIIGDIWDEEKNVPKEAETYARLLDGAPAAEESAEAMLRLALLGAHFKEQVELVEPYPAYRIFYRPAPTLMTFVEGRRPLLAQRALRGLAHLARKQNAERKALSLLARAFKDYPESIESGLAYEEFMALLENYLNTKLSQSAYADVVEVYEWLKEPMGWVPNRDTGALSLSAGKAYGALGAPSTARKVFEEIRNKGSRSVSPDELNTQILSAKAKEGDPEAARKWAQVNKNDWQAQAFLADELAEKGEIVQARGLYKKAANLTSDPENKLDALAQADRLVVSDMKAKSLLEALRAKQDQWIKLPPGDERAAWEAHGRITEARLKFSLGDYDGAARILRSIKSLSPADTYVLALAENKVGRWKKSAELMTLLAKADDPVYAGLAELHLEIESIKNSERKNQQ